MLITLVEDTDPGFLGPDGVIVAEYPANAMRWQMTLAFDPATGFAYSAVDGVAEPGDAGCWEMFVPRYDEEILARSTADREDSFEPAGQLFTETDTAEGVPSVLAIADLEAIVGSLAAATPAGTHAGRRAIELGPNQLQQLVGHVAGIGGQIPALDGGTLTFDVDADGRLERYEVHAEGLDDQIRDRDRRHRLYRLTVTLEPLPETFQDINSTTPRRQAGGCLDRSAALVGSWRLASGNWGADNAEPSLAAITDSTARLSIDEHGAIAGTTDCRSFTGSARREVSWLTDVELQIEGEACTEEMARIRDENLLAVLQSDPRILVYTDGIALVGGDGVVTLVAGD
ncbi:MAG: hypothetical protein ACRBI6_02625 [Acidimicrobiales bacterium]